MDYDAQIEAVHAAMQEPVLSAEEQIERRCDAVIRELDEFCAMAANSETADLIDTERMAFGQMHTRVQLILSFLIARNPNTFRIVQNNG